VRPAREREGERERERERGGGGSHERGGSREIQAVEMKRWNNTERGRDRQKGRKTDN